MCHKSSWAKPIYRFISPLRTTAYCREAFYNVIIAAEEFARCFAEAVERVAVEPAVADRVVGKVAVERVADKVAVDKAVADKAHRKAASAVDKAPHTADPDRADKAARLDRIAAGAPPACSGSQTGKMPKGCC